MSEQKSLLTWYNNHSSVPVEWLWYPYIPAAKISVLQGDPGGGKSMMMLDIISKLTTGEPLPDGKRIKPINVIYQCSEDGIEDTILPRLERAGADCSRVAHIEEDLTSVTLDDDLIRQMMVESDARLLVVDPFQAYLGDSYLANVIDMRRVLRKLSLWAKTNNCAVVLVGHLNKKSGRKDLYRGLGSVDIMALARSVLQVDKSEEDHQVRCFRQIKNSLSENGADQHFRITSDGLLHWEGTTGNPFNDDLGNHNSEVLRGEKSEEVADVIVRMLANGPIKATEIMQAITDRGISQRTVKIVKKKMGVKSLKKQGQWYWILPSKDAKYPTIER